MPNTPLQQFIEERSFCPELLFADWESFLDLLYAKGGSVSGIQWWDHCKKSEHGSSIGMGGYADPEDSEYLYVETQIYEDGFDDKSLEDVKAHIIEVKSAGISYNGFVSFDLVPSFDIRD